MGGSNGVVDMADAMRENRPQRMTGVQAAHVVDIVRAIQTASGEGCRVEITSEFPQPAPWTGQDNRLGEVQNA